MIHAVCSHVMAGIKTPLMGREWREVLHIPVHWRTAQFLLFRSKRIKKEMKGAHCLVDYSVVRVAALLCVILAGVFVK